LEESGWRIQNRGSGLLLVNQNVVEGPTPLRSGDIIRMSDMGPDLTFTLISRPKDAVATVGDALESSEAHVGATTSQAGTITPAEPRTGERQHLSAAVIARLRSPTALGVSIGIAVFLVVAVAALLLRPSTPESSRESTDANESPELQDTHDQSVKEGGPNGTRIDSEAGEVTSASSADQRGLADKASVAVTDAGPEPGGAQTNAMETPEPDDPWNAVTQRLAPAVCLVLAEEPGIRTAFPYGTACAIRSDALLTSAALALELDKRRRSGWKIWAEWPARGERLAVREIRVHQGFVGADDTPCEESIYWDLAILLVDGELKSVAVLAGPGEVRELEPGCEPACLGIPHDGEPLTRFDVPAVELTRGKLFQQSTLATPQDADRTAAPVLLHLKAPVPHNMYGGPILNQAGSVVAVYAEKAQLPDTEADQRLQIHYAPVVTLGRAWLMGQGLEHWIMPK
jgi:hypothetical protein